MPPASRRRILWVTLIGVAATTFPVTVLASALPAVADDLDTSDATAAWVITAPLLIVAVLTPIAGKLGDLYGHRRMFLFGFAASGVVHLLTALSPNIAVLIVLRTLGQGLASTTGPSALAMLMTVFTGTERNKAMGAWSAVISGSPALGVVIGGPLVDLLGWQMLFVIQGIGSLLAVVAAYPVLPSTPPKENVRFDIVGAATLGLGVAALLVALNRGPTLGWNHPAVLGGLLIGPLALVAFTRVEARVAHPLMPPEIVHQKKVVLLLGSQLLTQVAYMGGFVVSPFLLDRIFGFGTTAIALIMVGRPLAFSASAAVAGARSHRYRSANVVAGSVLLIAAALFVTGVGAGTEILVVVILGMAASGAGMGFGRPVMITELGNSVADEDLGVASGTFQMVAQFGSAIGISSLTAMVGESTSPARFFAVFTIAAVVAVVAAGLGWLALARQPDSADVASSAATSRR